MAEELQIIPEFLLENYKAQVPEEIQAAFDGLCDAEISTHDFSFYTSVSSVYSSKIEGDPVELDSYIKHKKYHLPFLPDYTQKVDDMYNAYIYAKSNDINEINIAEAHKILSQHFVAKHHQGIYRNQNMYVTTPDGKIEYVAASPFEVAAEMKKFNADLAYLIDLDMSIEETFFYASCLHLVFVKIHPWMDGNGRSGRLIEKWFLAQKLGEKAWFIESEKHYYKQHENYYNNLRALGIEYPELDYSKALPFLLMLPYALLHQA